MSKFGSIVKYVGVFFGGYGTSELVRKLRARKARHDLFRMDPADLKKMKDMEIAQTAAAEPEETATPAAETEEQLEMDIPPLEDEPHNEDDKEGGTIFNSYVETTKKYLPKAPYVITDEEFFDEDDGYSQVTLTLYADGTLVDQNGSEIEAPGMFVGNNVLVQMESFGERCKYVKNEKFKIKYEILKVDTDYYAEGEDDDVK